MTTTPQIITPLICKGCGCGYHTNLAVCPSCGLPVSGCRGPVAFDEPADPADRKSCPYCGVYVPEDDPCERTADYCGHDMTYPHPSKGVLR